MKRCARRWLFQYGGNKFIGDERTQILSAFPDSQKPDGNRTLLGNRDQQAAPGGAVQFGQHQSGKAKSVVECSDLGEAVLASPSVEHKPDLMRCTGLRFGNDTLQSLELVHEVQLGRQAS